MGQEDTKITQIKYQILTGLIILPDLTSVVFQVDVAILLKMFLKLTNEILFKTGE